MTTAHLPIAPYVPESHAHQRYFSRGEGTKGLRVQGGSTHKEAHGSAYFTVMRFADKDAADVELQLTTAGQSSTTVVACSAQELRAIALRLLDAAHDIEANPAAKLMAQEAMETTVCPADDEPL